MPSLHNAQTAGATPGQKLHPVKATLDDELPICVLTATITTGSTPPAPGRGIGVTVHCSNTDITAAQGAERLVSHSAHIKAIPSPHANGVLIYKSEPFLAEGVHAYAWLTADDLGTDVTITTSIEQIA